MEAVYEVWEGYLAGRVPRSKIVHEMGIQNSKYIISLFHQFQHLMGAQNEASEQTYMEETGPARPKKLIEGSLQSEDDVTGLVLARLSAEFKGSQEGSHLRIHVGERAFRVVKEGRVTYTVGGRRIAHKSDLLVEDTSGTPLMSFEVVFRSAVTDHFKARSFDSSHIKQEHPRMKVAMVYVKSNTGISPELARAICYDFDYFFSVPEAEAGKPEAWKPLLDKTREWLGEVG